MNNQLAIISHPELGEVRNILIKGEPWFVAKDICDVLGLVNSRKATSNLDDDEKGVSLIVTSSGRQDMTVVNEAGLYNLIFQSRKPEAKQFRKWVTGEVLPSIRKFGFYVHPSVRLTKKQEKQLNRIMLDTVNQYTTYDDIRKCASKLGVTAYYVKGVLAGRSQNNNIMMEMQKRAMRNRGEWSNAYSPDRIIQVLDALNGGNTRSVISVDDRAVDAAYSKRLDDYWKTQR